MKNLGFTLVELIIVVAIIVLLAAAAFVAIDPAQRIGDANDAQRWSDVTAVVDAILKYTVDNNGALPSSVSGMTADIYYGVQNYAPSTGCSALGGGSSKPASAIDLTTDLVDTYLPTIPSDPTYTTETGYIIKRSSNNRIYVAACDQYDSTNAQSIEVIR